VRTIRATDDGTLPGVWVIAIHGHLHADATPARRAPVYADDGNRLLRIVEVQETPSGSDVLVEIAHPPLQREGDLPGYATRVGPWPARLDDHVIMLGPAEVSQAHRLRARLHREEPPRVEAFVRWLRSGQGRDEALQAERIEDGVAWYCTQPESFALFQRVHRLAREELFEAVREGDADAIEENAWWLSRAAIADQDIWLAGAALRRVASLDWEIVIREGLQLRGKYDLTAGLAKADWHLDHPPPVPLRSGRRAPVPYPKGSAGRLHVFDRALVAREKMARWDCGEPSPRSIGADGRSLESSRVPRGPRVGMPKHDVSVL